MLRLRPLTIVLVLVFAASLVLATGCKGRSSSSRGEGPGFTLKDLSGKDISLSDFRGKVVLLEFWATWCGPCRLAVPELIKLNERLKGRDFAIVAISMDERKKDVEEFVKEEGIPYTVLIDDADVASHYGVFSIPTSFVIDRDGKVLTKHMGYAEGMMDDIAAEVEKLLSPAAVAPASPSEGQSATEGKSGSQGETSQPENAQE